MTEKIIISAERYNFILEKAIRMDMLCKYISDSDIEHLNNKYNTDHRLSSAADSTARKIIDFDMPDEVFNLRNDLIRNDNDKVIENADN